MVTQEDTIFIQGMNPSTTEDELCQHFGSIGIIKVLHRFCLKAAFSFMCLLILIFHFH